MRALLVAGARPQFIKAAALLPALRERGEACLLHTGQHGDPRMVEAHFAGLGLAPPDRRLDPHGGTRAHRLAAMIDGVAGLLSREPFDRVVVLGDTDSTVAAALAASLEGVPVAHVEAGARSGERDLPEERNRILVDELSSLLYCSTRGHAASLQEREGVEVVGDLMADLLMQHEPAIRAKAPQGGPYGVLTLHRAASADCADTVGRVLEASARAGVKVIFPVHPRTARSLRRVPEGIEILPPLPYLEFLGLVAGARFVLTDSGGLQKEAYLLGVPCITLRERTEWTETVEAGWNRLAGTDPDRIRAALGDPPRGVARPALYGDGCAAQRIARSLTSD